MGYADKLSKAVNNFLSTVNNKNIYEWLMRDRDQSDAGLDPIVKIAKVEYNLYLADMTPKEKHDWKICHQKGREMACEALGNYTNSDIKKAFEYFALDNAPEINQEIFAKDAQHHAEIFNQIREYFHNKPYDRIRVLAYGRMERETATLNRYWDTARKNTLTENQKMKEILKMEPEELATLNSSEFHNINFNGADVIIFRKLNEKYFNDPLVNKHVERIEEIVSETEQLRKQIEYNWKTEQNKRDLPGVVEGKLNNLVNFVMEPVTEDNAKGSAKSNRQDSNRNNEVMTR